MPAFEVNLKALWVKKKKVLCNFGIKSWLLYELHATIFKMLMGISVHKYYFLLKYIKKSTYVSSVLVPANIRAVQLVFPVGGEMSGASGYVLPTERRTSVCSQTPPGKP